MITQQSVSKYFTHFNNLCILCNEKSTDIPHYKKEITLQKVTHIWGFVSAHKNYFIYNTLTNPDWSTQR